MESLLAHCSAAFAQHGNVFVAFFVGGLAGSLTHCLSMCGPLVACQAACSSRCGSARSNATQWQYQAGRLVSYSLLGLAAATVSRHLAQFSFWPTLSALMLVLAGTLFIFSALYPGQHTLFAVSGRAAWLRGVLMGFMPCGLLYAALMMAATLANPLSGMFAMASFTLGTIPVLLLASGSATLLARRWSHVLQRVGRVGLACNGLVLLGIALKLAKG